MNQKKNRKKKHEKRNIIQNMMQNISAWMDIQSLLMTVLSALTIVTTIVMGLLIYSRFKMSVKETAISNAESRIESTVDQVNNELRNMRQICNAVNYNIVQEYDISDQEFSRQFSLLYEVNNDKLQSMALYDSDGKIIAAEPVATREKNQKVTEQDWYKSATDEIENIHISTPHIQDLFGNETYQYNWVVSLSSLVDMNHGDTPDSGVLLVDMKYSMIEEVLDNLNEAAGETYYYLCTDDGEILYHPRKAEIDRGLFTEDSSTAAGYADGTYEISVNGEKSNIVVNSLSYTGWKLVGVVPEGVQTASINKFRYYIIATAIILLMMLFVVNKIMAKKISKPILKLDESVKSYETGEKTEIYIGGASEIRHLAYSVQNSYKQIEQLMEEIIRQQNKRRKSEMDALQSQINPHFLYNTLESIRSEALIAGLMDVADMTESLAAFFRYTISKVENLVSVEEELQNCMTYFKIQRYRFGDRLQLAIECDEEEKNEIYQCRIPKLTLQPILENSIIHGTECKLGTGHIRIRLEKTADCVLLWISDDGSGMDESKVAEINEKLQKSAGMISAKETESQGGIALVNVNNRIHLLFGEEYGLHVYSMPDVGTDVEIRLPAVYSEREYRQYSKKESCSFE